MSTFPAQYEATWMMRYHLNLAAYYLNAKPIPRRRWAEPHLEAAISWASR